MSLRIAKSVVVFLAALAAVNSYAIMPKTSGRNSDERKLPFSAEAERSVLGAVMLDNDAILKVMPILREDDFFGETNRKIYRGMIELVSSGKAIDPVTLGEVLKNDSQGAAYLMSLTDGLPRATNVKFYGEIIVKKAKLRAVIRTCDEVMQSAGDDADAAELTESAISRFLSLTGEREESTIREWNEVAESAIAQINEARKNPKSVCRINAGIRDLDEMTGGLRKKELAMIVGMPGHGKAQPMNSRLLTPSGYVSMQNICVGDQVIGADGQPTKVIGVYPQGIMPVYRILFSDGSSTESTGSHLWNIRKRNMSAVNGRYKDRDFNTVTLDSIIKSGLNRKFIPMCGKVEFSCVTHTIDPYVMGVLIGDGGLTTHMPSVTIAEPSIVTEFCNRLPAGVTAKPHGKFGYYLSGGKRKGFGNHRGNRLAAAIRGYGLQGKKSDTKFIPEAYLFSCSSQRELLLQGLMDSDGTVSKFGDDTGHSVEFSSTSRRLVDDVRFLVQSLGGTARTYPKHSTFTYKGVKKTGLPSWRLLINLPPYVQPFRSTKKLSVYEIETNRLPCRAIRNIEYVGEKECQCIRVANEDGLYLTDDFIVTHNSLIAEEFATTADDDGHKGLIFSAEMSAESVVLRQLSYESDTFLYHLRRPEGITPERFENLSLAAKKERCLPIVDRGITPDRVFVMSEARKRTKGLDFVVVDYDQLVIGAGMNKSSDPEMFFARQGDFIIKSKELAKRLDIAFILLAQPRKTPPGVVKGGKWRPSLDDIYGHSAMRNAPDVVMWVVREFFMHGLDKKYEHKATVHVIKARNDQTGHVAVEFDPQRVRFLDKKASEESEEI